MSEIKDITVDGLWKNNPGFVQLLGLCPLLAVTGTVVNALGMGIATLLVLVGSNVTVSIIRDWVRQEIRIPVFVIVIAAYVTIVELVMQAVLFDLYQILGLFIALITTNCAIIGRAEAFAARNTVPKAFLDGLMQGLGFTIALLALGAMREVLGFGTLFANADFLFGSAFAGTQITLFENYDGFLLAVLPPGAFIGLGLLIAGKNAIDRRNAQKSLGKPAVVGDPDNEDSVAAKA